MVHWWALRAGYASNGKAQGAATGSASSQGYNLDKVEENPAYNTSLRLLNHTDQVSYGGPGFLLAFHCVAGQAGVIECNHSTRVVSRRTQSARLCGQSP